MFRKYQPRSRDEREGRREEDNIDLWILSRFSSRSSRLRGEFSFVHGEDELNPCIMSKSTAIPWRNGLWLVTGSREIHQTPWLRVREDQIVWPSQKAGTWTVIEMKPAVGIVAITADRQVHLVGQHRYAVDRYEWEIPAGCIDEGEEPLTAAKRELREETGVAAKRWTPLGATHPHNGSCDAIYHLFLAEDLEQGHASPEPDELLMHKLVSFDDLLRMVQHDEILDAMTVVGVYRAWHAMKGD
jgi:8-oxo-dGTP pyrophosphatase MutT (NUDIX family)